MEERDCATTAADGTRIAYVRYNRSEGPHSANLPVVLLHGMTAEGRHWHRRGWVRPITDNGHVVVAVDLRGHGRSDKPHDVGSYSVDAMAGDIATIVRSEGWTAGGAVIFGYSLGSRVALAFERLHPELCAACILGGPSPLTFNSSSVEGVLSIYKTLEQGTEAWIGFVRTALAAMSVDEADMEEVFGFSMAHVREMDTVAMWCCVQAVVRVLQPEEGELVVVRGRVPMLLMCGDNDEAGALAKRLHQLSEEAAAVAKSASQVSVAVVEGADHMSTFAKPDKGGLRAVTNFLEMHAK